MQRRWHSVGLLMLVLAGGVIFDSGAARAQTPSDTSFADPLRADAFVRRVFAEQDSARYEQAAAAYLSLLTHLEHLPRAEGRAVRRYHLAPLTLILPGPLRAATGLDDIARAIQQGVPDDAGERLVAWWRSADTRPATPENERLAEHLERVAYAAQHFGDGTTDTGFDDRGHVYIRLGPPDHKTRITFAEQEVTASLSFNHVDFPANAFWTYGHVDVTAQYLFYQPRSTEGFRLGLPRDLIPSSLHTPRHTRQMLAAMAHIYRKLSLWHHRGHYGLIYDRIAEYVDRLETHEFTEPLFAENEPRDGPENALAFAQRTISSAQSQDRRAAQRREEAVPPAFSNVFDDTEALPVALRYARFLEPDGTTRTELYWGLQARDLKPSRRLRRQLEEEGHEPTSHYLLDLAVVQHAADYRARERYRDHHLVHAPVDSADADVVIPVQTFTVRGDTGRYHLALEWDVAWARLQDEGGDEVVETSPTLKIATAHLDTLHALRADPGRLEMSDLKPLRLMADEPLDAASPYPHGALTPDVQLALAFEVYHLAYGADDRTHYRVAYEVKRRDERGVLIPRPPREQRTTTETSYTADSRTARETLLLELSDLDDVDRLGVTVRVTDETTGQSVARTLDFTVRR